MAQSSKKKESVGYKIAVSGMKSFIRVLILVVVIIVLVILARTTYTLGYNVFNTKPIDEGEGRDIIVTISDDMSVYEIGRMLNREGLLDEEPQVFWVQEFISDYHKQLLPGTYTLNTAMSVDEMLQVLAQGGQDGES